MADRIVHRSRRPPGGPRRAGPALRRGRPHAPAVRTPRRRAVRGGDRALRRPPARGRGGRGAVTGVEPPARRARSLERLRHPDVRDPARAGPAGRAGAGRSLAGGVRQGGGVAARPGGAHGRAGDGARGPRRARPDPGPGARHAAPVALARLADLPGRRVLDREGRGDGEARVRRAPAARGKQRDDRARGGVLRGGRSLPGDARRCVW